MAKQGIRREAQGETVTFRFKLGDWVPAKEITVDYDTFSFSGEPYAGMSIEEWDMHLGGSSVDPWEHIRAKFPRINWDDPDVVERFRDEIEGAVARAAMDAEESTWLDEYSLAFEEGIGDAVLESEDVPIGVTSILVKEESNPYEGLYVFDVTVEQTPEVMQVLADSYGWTTERMGEGATEPRYVLPGGWYIDDPDAEFSEATVDAGAIFGRTLAPRGFKSLVDDVRESLERWDPSGAGFDEVFGERLDDHLAELSFSEFDKYQEDVESEGQQRLPGMASRRAAGPADWNLYGALEQVSGLVRSVNESNAARAALEGAAAAGLGPDSPERAVIEVMGNAILDTFPEAAPWFIDQVVQKAILAMQSNAGAPTGPRVESYLRGGSSGRRVAADEDGDAASMEHLVDEWDLDEGQAKMVANFLEAEGFTVDDIQGISVFADLGDGITVEAGTGEWYLYADSDAAKAAARMDIKQMIDEMGVAGTFKDGWWQKYVDEDGIARDIESDERNDLYELVRDGQYDQAIEDEFDDAWDGDDDARDDALEARMDEVHNDPEQWDGFEAALEYKVKAMVDDIMRDPGTYLGDGGLEPYIDTDRLIEDAINIDGTAHFIARYDGVEGEGPDGAVWYRVN